MVLETLHNLAVNGCQLNGKAWRMMRATVKFLQSSLIFHHPSRCWNDSSVPAEIKFHHGCNVLIDRSHQIFWSERNWIEYLSDNTSWYIIEPGLLQSGSFLHIPLKWLISMDSHQKIILMTWRACQMNVTAKVCRSLFYCSRSNGWSILKSLLLFWCYMILSITFLNRWDFPFANNDPTYLFSHRFSTSTGMFLWSPTIVTDIWKLRKKWSKLHVIYFSVLISNWTGMM